LRDEFLNVHDFVTMHDLREKLRVWQEDYNHRRPHGSLANLTPSEFARRGAGPTSGAARL
jgi:putative transposase